MKHLYFFVILITSSLLYSQECKYDKNEVDEFTKNKILETKFEWLGNNFGYNFKKINDSKFLRIEIHHSKVFSIRDGSKLMFLTEKEEPITILFPKYEISKVSSASNYYVVQYLNLSEELLSRFKNEKISKARIYTTDGYLEIDIKDKRSIKFKELLKCIE